MSSRIESPTRVGKAGILGLTIAAFALAFSAPSASAALGPINAPGQPLTRIQTSEQLECQLVHGSALQFDTGSVDMDNYCGTFVATEGSLYGAEDANDSVDFPYDPVSQDLSGDGSSATPFKLTTVVQVPEEDGVEFEGTSAAPAQGVSLLTVTETETYFNGDQFFRTDLTVHNDASFDQTPTLYHVGDCYLGGTADFGYTNSDLGFAVNDTATSRAVFCTPDQPIERLDRTSTVPSQGSNSGILGFVPIGGDSHFREALSGEGDGPLFNATTSGGGSFTDACDDCALNPNDPETSPVDNGVGLSWALSLPVGASATRCFLTVNSTDNSVPPIPSGCTPAASPPATIAQKPSSCKLRISRARVFLFRRHPRLRLVARYRSADPADVLINFVAIEGSNKVNLGDVTRHFHRHGLFRLREELSQEQSDTLWQTHRFIVHLKIPGEPGFCERKYKKELTVPRIIDGQRVVFQTDSSFGFGPGHPEH